MIFDSKRMIRPDLVALDPYQPIIPFEVLSRQLNRPAAEIVKLDANENPYGPSPLALEALAQGKYYHIYPDPEATELREALGHYCHLPPDRLLAGAGADELIDLVLRATLSPGEGVIDCPPSFGMYPFSTAVNAGRYIAVERRADFTLDVAAIEDAVRSHRPKILFLCSPNNPDGSVLSDESLKHLLRLPLLVILDEAYIDFAELDGHQNHLTWVMEYDNLVVLRTFSKLAGLAGLRIGYGAFPEWLLPHLWKIKQPYNINVAATQATLASLADTEWLLDRLERLIQERGRLFRSLKALPFLSPYPSQANFILCRVQGLAAGQLKSDLAQAGILVRYFNKPGLENMIRISVGRPQDTDRLLEALPVCAQQQ